MATAVHSKACARCGEVKPLDSFSPMRRGLLGRHPVCKPCKARDMRERRQRDPEHVRALAARSRSARRERIREQDRERRAANRERYREADRARSRDPNRRAYAREYGRNAARRRRLGVDAEASAYAELVLSDPCAYCDAPANHADHIVPVARGGVNAWDNLTGACASCNFRKATSDLLPFLLRRP
jgi:5-methylcytosine-specific restriction endonuclease McrA